MNIMQGGVFCIAYMEETVNGRFCRQHAKSTLCDFLDLLWRCVPAFVLKVFL